MRNVVSKRADPSIPSSPSPLYIKYSITIAAIDDSHRWFSDDENDA